MGEHDDDQFTRRRTTRDPLGRLAFDRRDSADNNGAHWSERVKRPGERSEELPAPEFRRTWGNKTSPKVAVNGANVSGRFQQVVDARFPFPTSWNIGLYFQLNSLAASGLVDPTTFEAIVTYGLGMTTFVEAVPLGTLTTNTSGMLFLRHRPAETIFVEGVFSLAFNDATPHDTILTFGALVAPEVYI